MASFKTHITGSGLVGLGYAAGAYTFWNVPLPTCVLAGGLCGVSGMLPDLDSGSSRPLRESLAFAAAVVPIMLVTRLAQFHLSREYLVLAGAFAYLFVRFVVGELLKRYTVHRGMFHSIPAAVIAGELTFLLASGPVELRIYKAGAVALGYLTHLVLDEGHSIGWHRGRLRLKRSFGTALKMYSKKWWANGSTYLKLILLTFIVINEPGWTEQFYQKTMRDPIQQTATQIRDRFFR